MSSWWKVLLVLALLLPVGGYAVWSLARGPGDPAPRAPMQLRPPTGDPTSVPAPERPAEPEPVPPRLGDLDEDRTDD